MQGKFRFSLDGVDATARQFSDVRRQLQELHASVRKGVGGLGGRVTVLEDDFNSLVSEPSQVDDDRSGMVVTPAHGGTGVRNAYDNLLSLNPRKPVYVFSDGTLGTDCSTADMVANVSDADEFVPVDAFRQVKWRVYTLKDDLNLNLDDAQPVIGLVAEDLDNAGLGFFCEYDADGNLTGVDYSKLSVAALRLAQEAMDEVDELRGLVRDLSSRIDKMGEASTGKSDS